MIFRTLCFLAFSVPQIGAAQTDFARSALAIPPITNENLAGGELARLGAEIGGQHRAGWVIARAHRVEPPTEAERPTRPPLSGERIAGELASGLLMTGVGALIALQMSVRNISDGNRVREYVGFPEVLTAVGGATVANSAAVWLVGSVGEEDGSFGASLLGSLAGSALTIAMLSDDFWHQQPTNIVIATVCPAVGATIGFNLTRRWDDGDVPRSEQAVLSFRDSALSLGVPRLSVRRGRDGALIRSADVLRVRF